MASLQDDPNNWVDRLGFTDYTQLDVIFIPNKFKFISLSFFLNLIKKN